MKNNLQAPRRRGRPLGSKNKRKDPMEKPSEGMERAAIAMQLKVLEIAVGSDVISAVSDFANRYKVDVSVISTYGLVCNLTIYRPREPPETSSVLIFEGIFDLLSLKGNFYGSLSSSILPSPFSANHIIYFVGREGHAIGGIVAGKVLAATKVYLVVSFIRETDIIKLPLTLPPPSHVSQRAPHSHTEATASKPEVSSTTRGSIASGIPSPTTSRFWSCAENGNLSPPVSNN